MIQLINLMREKGIGDADAYSILLIEAYWDYVLEYRVMTLKQIQDWNHRCMAYILKNGLGWNDYIGFIKRSKAGKMAVWGVIETKAKATLAEYDEMEKYLQNAIERN